MVAPLITNLRESGWFGGSIAFDYQGNTFYALPDHHNKLADWDLVVCAGLEVEPDTVFPQIVVDLEGKKERMNGMVQSKQLSSLVGLLEDVLNNPEDVELQQQIKSKEGSDVTDWPKTE